MFNLDMVEAIAIKVFSIILMVIFAIDLIWQHATSLIARIRGRPQRRRRRRRTN